MSRQRRFNGRSINRRQAVTDASILDAVNDPNLFAPWFGPSWDAWRAFLAALFDLPLGDTQSIFHACTGRSSPQRGGYDEAWLIVGRRGGKSFVLALVAVFLATFVDWTTHLAPGERGTVMVIAADRKQARVIIGYIRGLLSHVPMLAKLVERETTEITELTNRITIEVHTASFRTVRGYTVVAALCDEVAFWRSEDSANPDTEILAALRPSMATVPGSMLLCASSPYARRGALWDAHKNHYGKDSEVLVWKAPTTTMNPTFPQSIIDRAYAEDPAHAAAEYGAEFRSDVESYVPLEIVEACVEPGCYERPPIADTYYRAFVDPSGGIRDSMTLAVAHREGEMFVLDALRERRPRFSPEAVVEEFAALLTSYGISSVTGDRYAGEWPREQFRKHGIEYETSAKVKSDLYRDLLPLLNSGRAALLDNEHLTAQLVGLERRTARGGRDSIDHAPSAHDDTANAAAGALILAAEGAPYRDGDWEMTSLPNPAEDVWTPARSIAEALRGSNDWT